MLADQMEIFDTPECLGGSLGRTGSYWVGALSFEHRCLGSIRQMADFGLPIKKSIILKYSTSVYPKALSEERRDLHMKELHDMVETAQVIEISSHSYRAMQELVRTAVENSRGHLLIFDISCMSKIHTMALAYELSQLKSRPFCVVVYSVPENYGGLAIGTKPSGWKDIIMAPLSDTAQLFNETFSRGLILPGHDADRLVVALAELEPSGGQILIVDTPNRPDLRKLSRFKNQHIIRQLKRMRTRLWSETVVGLIDLSMLRNCIEDEISIARAHEAPLMLFPFGPKSLIFYAALILCDAYPQGSWFVYPIPVAYDVNYTEGIERMIWLMNKYEARSDGRPHSQGDLPLT